MKGQVFSMDLIIGAMIVTSVLISAYALSGYYTSLNQTYISAGNAVGEFSTAVTSFLLVNTTGTQLVSLQNGGSQSAFKTYVLQTLGKELDFPYYISVNVLLDYNQYLPNTNVFNYSSPTFSQNSSSIQQYNEPIFVTNSSSLCGSICNYSLDSQSAFPGENMTLNAPGCSIFNGGNSRVGPAIGANGWDVFNNTPTGKCTITVGPYITPSTGSGTPDNYLVKAYSGSTSSAVSEGEITVFSVALDLVTIKIV